jgi:hypothetical protein
MPHSNQSDEFPLADLIHALSEQLRRSESRAREGINSGDLPLIAWTSAQIEVGVTWTRDVHGQIDVKVLQLGGERTKENTATMTVMLKPAGDERQEHTLLEPSVVTIRPINPFDQERSKV